MQPTIGRIVHVTLGDKPVPMVITDVHDDDVVSGVALSAFGDGPHLMTGATSLRFVQHGSEDRQWDWPPRA